MGRQNNDSSVAVAHSSIALLQERFRQLQRAKEMREERQLLRLFSDSERLSPTTTTTTTKRYEPTRPFLDDPGLTMSPGTSSLYFSQKSQAKHAHLQPPVDTPLLTSLWPTDRSIMRAASNTTTTTTTTTTTFDHAAEVDTSLHL